MNTFDLAEDSISMENVFDWIEKLNTTHPLQFAQIADKYDDCNLESELDTVCSSPVQSRSLLHTDTFTH